MIKNKHIKKGEMFFIDKGLVAITRVTAFRVYINYQIVLHLYPGVYLSGLLDTGKRSGFLKSEFKSIDGIAYIPKLVAVLKGYTNAYIDKYNKKQRGY